MHDFWDSFVIDQITFFSWCNLKGHLTLRLNKKEVWMDAITFKSELSTKQCNTLCVSFIFMDKIKLTVKSYLF